MLKVMGIILIIIIVYIFITFNSLTKKRLRVKQAKSGIDIYLTQRFDLIPNLVECVKAYCKYEESVLTEITRLRASYNKEKDLSVGQELNNRYYGIMATVETYPELKADEQFLNLQKNLSKIESQLQAARRIYNSEVTTLNISIDTFPSSIIANLFNFKKEDLFEAEKRARENIEINIDKNK